MLSEVLSASKAGIAEIVIPPGSSLIGKSARDVWMRKTYGLAMIALHRDGETLREGDDIRNMPFKAGDTLRVHVRIIEGDKERIQVYQGVCIKRVNRGVGSTFTVRKISSGFGVERIFPLHSPALDKIEVVTRGRVRRAKIYYLRKLRGKAARIKERWLT